MPLESSHTKRIEGTHQTDLFSERCRKGELDVDRWIQDDHQFITALAKYIENLCLCLK